MEYDVKGRKIYSDKILNELDNLIIDFTDILKKYADYVIVSGYVSILLGRTRASEDIDLLVSEMPYNKFKEMFEDFDKNGFICMNTYNSKEAYEILDEHAIRFFRGVPVPNIEFKKITKEIQKEAYENRLKVMLKNKILFISPLELQIAYKLSLISKKYFKNAGSDKDFEDAKHLYEIFKEKLNKEQLVKYVKLFRVEDIWRVLKDEKY